MLLGVQVALVVVGLWAIVTGKISMFKGKPLRGGDARITGAILALPVIFAQGILFVLGMLIGLGTLNMPLESVSTFGIFLAIAMSVVAIGGSLAYAYMSTPEEAGAG